jgi:hypothetical protein
MKLVVVLLAGVLVLIANGNITFSYWSGSDDPGAASSAAPSSPTVRDVLALMGAATPPENDLDNAQINGLVTRVATTRGTAAIRLLERELPGLARRLDRKIRILSAQVARQSPKTSIGRKCRAATLRFLARQRVLFRRFGDGAARHGATRRGINRFTADAAKLQTSFTQSIGSCTAGATSAERAAIESALGG